MQRVRAISCSCLLAASKLGPNLFLQVLAPARMTTDHRRTPEQPMELPIRNGRAGRGLVIAALGALAALAPAQAQADSTQATCVLSRHDHTIPVQQGPCSFSQRQGNVTVRFRDETFSFPSAQQGMGYQRTNAASGIRFNREGEYTLQVLWTAAQQATTSKPRGWARDNVYLGRWQAGSTAGRAILDVLTLEPNRLRWGSALNGICDSDYSVRFLPWGRNGRFPDQLVPPSSPTDLVYGVVRLTLQPRPCPTGAAVLQLALPLDGSNAMQVVTYDASGKVIGSYPDLRRLP